MTRKTLGDMLISAPPREFRLRAYQPGDKKAWLRIHQLAEPALRITPEVYDEEFGCDEHIIAERQLFIADQDGTPAGTATAWFGRHFNDPEIGRVHYVAVLPQYQKRGLGAALVSAVCVRLRELGNKRAYLITWSNRPWAIRLYERLGFSLDLSWSSE